MSLFSDKKIAWLRHMTCQSLKNPLGQVNLCFFSKVTVCDCKGLAKLANIACQTLLFVSESLAMDNQSTLLFGREQ